MPTASEIAAYADTVLRTSELPDYPGALNGLQVETPAAITKIGAAVDFSSRTLNAAIRAKANLMVVHHGAFWQGAAPITGRWYHSISKLIAHSIGVYSSHLPLDCHPTLGNNALLARTLGLTPESAFAKFNGLDIGLSGESDSPLEELIQRARKFTEAHDGELRITRYDKTRAVGRWGLCTGSGAGSDTLKEAVRLGLDTLIVGEGPHWTSVFAEDNGIVLLYAGHYATETLGVQALAAELAKKFSIEWEFLPAPTGS